MVRAYHDPDPAPEQDGPSMRAPSRLRRATMRRLSSVPAIDHQSVARAFALPALPKRERIIRIAATTCALLYLIAMPAYLLTHGGWPTPDYLVPPLLLAAIALGRGWPFLLDWGPFLLLVLSWQATAGIANRLGRPVHVTGPLRAEQWLFNGNIPTIELQKRLFDPAQAQWYDWAATVQHALHFVLPVAVGLVLWLHSRRLYWRYLGSVFVLFYLAFLGYALYPAAPPWMAGLQEQIPFVHRVAVETVMKLPTSAPIGLAYTHFSANQVAAIPSLHAGLPLLLALVLTRVWGWRALPLLLYPLTMGYNLVYLGEHYVVDVLLGYAVALVAYAAVWVVPEHVRWRARLPALPKVTPPRAPRWLSASALPAIAVGSIVVIGFTLRPGRSAGGTGPVVPGLQVQAGQTGALSPASCEAGSSPSLTVGNLLADVAGRHSFYLFSLDSDVCYSLSALESFPPPKRSRVLQLAQRAPVRLAPNPRAGSPVEFVALRIGTPTAPMILAGLDPAQRYLVLLELADVPDFAALDAMVDAVIGLALVEEEPPVVPEAPPPAGEAPAAPEEQPSEAPPDPAPLESPGYPDAGFGPEP